MSNHTDSLPASAPVRPTGPQIEAADPRVSAWVGANAGSGKTRVLTHRVARLLLDGARPERILCLTYTKAAAAEMQNRLFATLGAWAMAPDDRLAAELSGLEGADAPPDPARLARARTLFAAALETPGGLRIQTIHAFCDALLRRFPLEAQVSPRFEVIDERQKTLMVGRILSDMAAEAEAGRDPAFDRIAARLNDGTIATLAEGLMRLREGFGPEAVEARIAAHLGPDASEDEDTIVARAIGEVEWDALGHLADVLSAAGGPTNTKAADGLTDARALAAGDPGAAASRLLGVFLTQKGERRSRNGFPTRAALNAWPEADALTDAMMDWAEATNDALRASAAGARARDLDAFARAFLGRYAAAKAARGLLDFEDLIQRTRDLVTRSELAAWTLYKLDRGIDHILVDEAQDTAPAQWDVIRALTQEFFAGESVGRAGRSLFVVGDEKQSIYSFQGAEPRAFGETRARLAEWLEGMGRSLARPDLATSFRSAPGILDFVDAVFAGEAAAGLTVDGAPVRHEAHRAGDQARVDLWPLIPPDEGDEDDPWWEPVDRPAASNPKLRLARTLAAEIRRMIDEDRRPARGGRPGARVRPGDILVLVTRRDLMQTALIRRLKTLGVPVAGSDRLTLAGELAVRDLMALVKVSITPADDLSLAALLRSPIFGLSEEALFALAHDRGRMTLRDRLRRAPEHGEINAVLDDMAGRADYLRPYEFLARALIRHGARRRLIARLGHEAEDPIDELLEQALSFEAREAPSLAGFVAWVEAGEIDVKREMEAGAGEVRVMTVHGAKGLEAPIVILPDTTSAPNRGGGGPRLVTLAGGSNAAPLVAWSGGGSGDPAALSDAIAEANTRQDEERKRLLYVALTRAEDWLILCGADTRRPSAARWYDQIAAGAQTIDGWTEIDGPAALPGPVRRLETGPGPDEGAEPLAGAPAAPPAARPAPPAWLTRAEAEDRAREITPSTLAPHEVDGGAGSVAAEGAGLRRETALLYGTAVHLVLERLAGYPAEQRAPLARRLLASAVPELDDGLREAAIAEALTVLERPFAAELFGPDSLAEVAVAADLPGAGPMSGRIDRLLVGPDRVVAIDFKTDSLPPAEPAFVRPEYLAQLGAYRAALAAAYPGREVRTAILWTATPLLMALPDAAVDAALAAHLPKSGAPS